MSAPGSDIVTGRGRWGSSGHPLGPGGPDPESVLDLCRGGDARFRGNSVDGAGPAEGSCATRVSRYPDGHTLDTIFVSIASYRDPELAATIDDCLSKARNPSRLRFGVCWQHGPEEIRPEQFSNPQFRVLDIDWRASRGACWARAQIMKLWEGQDWFLQLDSHHRFVDGWDDTHLAQAARTGSAKPVLTTYAGPYTPGDPAPLGPEPMRMEFDRFTEDGLVIFRPGAFPDWETNTSPRRARFASAHFLFAPGRFVEDVPYDPRLLLHR